jgi:tyrosinase
LSPTGGEAAEEAMAVSRRSVLLQGAVIGAGVIASGVPGMKALAAGQPPQRRSLQGLAWNDPIVATYRDGVGLLKQKPATDKISWAGLAGILPARQLVLPAVAQGLHPDL